MWKSKWIYAPFLTSEECDKVLQTMGDTSLIDATVTTSRVIDQEIRDSKIAWINRGGELDWLFRAIDAKMDLINRHHFDIDYYYGCYDSIQYTTYTEGDFYNSHVDSFYPVSEMMDRKLSCSILLSDPSDYTGGELVVDGGTLSDEQLERGQIVAFPSLMTHKVQPVKSGKRVSLVVWIYGRTWR